MQNTDWFVLAMTFITGVAAGAFIYFSGFQAIDPDPSRATGPVVGNFEILVSTYGGCAMGGRECPSYKLIEDGSYVFISDGRSYSGQISNGQLLDIKIAMSSMNLGAQSELQNMDDCESYTDGIDTRYLISANGEQYVLDTCGTAVDVDHEFIELLDELMGELSSSY